MYICEYCGKIVNDEDYYGSGRFCSRSCSCGWASKNQSEESKARKIKALRSAPRTIIYGRHHSEETKLKISRRVREVMNNPEVRYKISEANRGRTLSELTRQKISLALKDAHKSGKNKGWTIRKGQSSYAEDFWESVLINNSISYIKEYKVNKPGPGCYFMDFLIDGMIDLEIDGHQHYEESRKLHDYTRDEYMRSKGYLVYRIKYVNPTNSIRVKNDIDNFIEWYNSVKL